MANKFEEQIRILELVQSDLFDVWADIPVENLLEENVIDYKMGVIEDALLDIEEILYNLGKED